MLATSVDTIGQIIFNAGHLYKAAVDVGQSGSLCSPLGVDKEKISFLLLSFIFCIFFKLIE